MKYIRTKDGRIVKHPHPNADVFTFRYEILEQADTIEELCDVIVCNKELFYSLTSYDGSRHFNWEEIISSSHNVEDLYLKIYGAIWTDKGLIYIAKMNEKGELKLL